MNHATHVRYSAADLHVVSVPAFIHGVTHSNQLSVHPIIGTTTLKELQ